MLWRQKRFSPISVYFAVFAVLCRFLHSWRGRQKNIQLMLWSWIRWVWDKQTTKQIAKKHLWGDNIIFGRIQLFGFCTSGNLNLIKKWGLRKFNREESSRVNEFKENEKFMMDGNAIFQWKDFIAAFYLHSFSELTVQKPPIRPSTIIISNKHLFDLAPFNSNHLTQICLRICSFIRVLRLLWCPFTIAKCII